MRFLYTTVHRALLFLCSCAFFIASYGQVGTVQLGSGNGTSTDLPTSYNWGYNYSQVIYTAAELTSAGAVAGPISKVRFKTGAAVNTEFFRNWTVYMANTTKVGFVSSTDLIPLASLTQVFTGNIVEATSANQWFEIVFTTPFIWDGTSNVVLAVDENTASYSSTNNPQYKSYTLAPTTGSKGIYAKSDTVNPDPATATTGSLTRGVSNNVPQVQFEATTLPCMPIISLLISGVTNQTATIEWTANGVASAWDVEWGSTGFTPGTGTQLGNATATQNSHQITGLTQNTTYQAFVRSNCGVDGTSVWMGPLSFTTTQTPVNIPYYDAFDANNWVLVNNTTGVNGWAVGSAAGNPPNALYVSNNNGTTAQYTLNSASYSRASKQFTLPATVTSPLKIRYNWIGKGETTTSDRIRVWLVPSTSILPAMGTDISTTNTTGAVVVGLTNHNGDIGLTWQEVTFNVPPALLGTNVQVVIEWKNDTYLGNNSTAQAIDNFAIYYTEASPSIIQSAAVPTCLDGSELSIETTPTAPNVAYWQVSATGTSTDNAATTPWTIFENGTYYVRTLNTFTNEWSTASSIVVTNFEVAVAPPAPIAAANPTCLPGTEIVVVGNPPADVAYYWQGNLATNSNVDLPATSPYFVSETGTYYVKAKNNVSGCWSDAVGLLVTVQTTIPANPTTTQSLIEVCSNTTPININASTIINQETCNATASVSGYDIDLITATVTNFSCATGTVSNAVVDVTIGTGCTNGFYSFDLIIDGQEVLSNSCAIANFNIMQYYPFTSVVVRSQDDDDDDDYITMNLTVKLTHGEQAPIVWFDAPEQGTIIGNGNVVDATTFTNIDVTQEGIYTFYASSNLDYCYSAERTPVTVELRNIKVVVDAIDATCNNGIDGSFIISDTICGTAPFEYSVDGGAYSTAIANDLATGTHTIKVKDANGFESSLNTIIIASPAGPSEVEEVSITNSSAVVTWVANGSETQWNVEWGTVGFTPGTGTFIGSEIVNDTIFTITGLNSDTEYDVYISANCGNGATIGDWDSVRIWTTCDIQNIPFAESFEDDSETLSCWDVTDVVGNGNWNTSTGSSANITTAFEGTKNARFAGSVNTSARLVSPTFDVADQDSVALVFAIGQPVWLGDQNTTKVYARPTSTEPWTLLKEYTANINAWKVDTIVVDVTGTTLEFSFVATDNSGRDNVIDAVKVFPCSIEPMADVAQTICRTEHTIDLMALLNPVVTSGRWVFNEIPSLIAGSQFSISNLADGTYNAYYIVSTPCASDTTIATITVVSPGGAGIGATINACKNQHVNLFGGLSGIVNFGGTWYDPQGNILPNATFAAGSLAGQYIYRYVVDNGACVADTSEVILSIGACNYLGAEELSELENVSVSPNPSNGLFQISGITTPDFKYEVLDLNGRVVVSEKAITSSVTNVNLTSVENGVYMIRLRGEGSEKMIRVIKQ